MDAVFQQCPGSSTVRALLWQIPHIPKHSRIRAGSSRHRLSVCWAEPTQGWGKPQKWHSKGDGPMAVSPCGAPVPPVLDVTQWIPAASTPCPQGPFPAESITFVQVIMKSQSTTCLSKLYLHSIPSALESRLLYIFRSKLYLIFIFK